MQLEQPPPSIHALPDALLVSIFKRISLKNRCRFVSRVCRRWAVLVCSPALLRHVEIVGYSDSAGFQRRALSAASWLERRAAGHVRTMDLDLGLSLSLAPPDPTLDLTPAGEALMTALAACGGSSGLRKLDIRLPPGMQLGAWLEALDGLAELAVFPAQREDLVVSAQLDRLASLQRLRLACPLEGARAIQLAPHVRLPPSLTSLILQGDTSRAMPAQVSALTNLRSLLLHKVGYAAAACQPLAALHGCLERLEVVLAAVPADLSLLTALRHLGQQRHAMDGCRMDANGQAAVHAALPRLQRLTHLELADLAQAPAALSALCELRTLCLPRCRGQLPPGPWLAGVRELTARHALLADSLGALAAAEQLHELVVLPTRRGAEPRMPDFMQWAVRCASLRLLWMELMGRQAGDVDSVRQAQESRPDLTIRQLPDSARFKYY